MEFPPFDRWNLPPSEDIKFSIIKKADRYAHYQMVNGVHHIAVSTKLSGGTKACSRRSAMSLSTFIAGRRISG
jgi:hypothetical protein